MKTRKTLAVLVSLIMAFGLFATPVFATTTAPVGSSDAGVEFWTDLPEHPVIDGGDDCCCYPYPCDCDEDDDCGEAGCDCDDVDDPTCPNYPDPDCDDCAGAAFGRRDLFFGVRDVMELNTTALNIFSTLDTVAGSDSLVYAIPTAAQRVEARITSAVTSNWDLNVRRGNFVRGSNDDAMPGTTLFFTAGRLTDDEGATLTPGTDAADPIRLFNSEVEVNSAGNSRVATTNGIGVSNIDFAGRLEVPFADAELGVATTIVTWSFVAV